ncbi:hypothetical protein [Rhizobium sp.]
MRKSEYQRLAQSKIDDAIVLQTHGRPSNAYYLAGYAIEFAIKACISRQFVANDIPNPKLVRDIHTHDLAKLISLAGLQQELNEQIAASKDFAANWSIVKDWSEASRYDSFEADDSQYIISAITNPENGVLQWIKTHW